MGNTHFLTRGLKSVCRETALSVLGYNINPRVALVGVRFKPRERRQYQEAMVERPGQMEGCGARGAQDGGTELDQLPLPAGQKSIGQSCHGGKQRAAIIPGFGTFRSEFRKGLDRFKTVMARVWQVCLVNQAQRTRS